MHFIFSSGVFHGKDWSNNLRSLVYWMSAGLLWPLTQILSDPTCELKSPPFTEKRVSFRLIVSGQWTRWAGRCDMQSRCFDICLTVKIHRLQNAVCDRAAWVFSHSTMEMSHRDMWRAAEPIPVPWSPFRGHIETPHWCKTKCDLSLHHCTLLLLPTVGYGMLMRAGKTAVIL